jgi:PKD repeat protein
MPKKFLATSLIALGLILNLAPVVFAQETTAETLEEEGENLSYLQSVIGTDLAIEIQKSTIFDASQSFLPNPDTSTSYAWDFGDGNKNEGVEVLHAYQEPGAYTVTLSIDDGSETSISTIEVFAYKKLIILITDQTEDQERINIFKNIAEKSGVFMKVIDGFGSSTEFISEEVLSKKLTEEAPTLQKAKQIAIWTKENAGLNALSRFIQNNPSKNSQYLEQKNVVIFENKVASKANRIERQFELIKAQSIIVAKEGSFDALISSTDDQNFLQTIQERGDVYEVIDERSGKLLPWNFMSQFVKILINNGIPDNTIALLLLLPVIATVVAFMRQVVGITTYGIYTPSIITLSFLVIGVYAGLLTLVSAIFVAYLVRKALGKVRMLFIPKMAIVMTLVSLSLLIIIIISINLQLFDAQFLSIAIFPMLILSTLVEKFVSTKGEKSIASATVLMGETVLVALIAFIIAGGEINLGFTSFRFDFIKELMLTYPEIILLLLITNIGLGKWSGLRILERIRFREVLRHIEE